MNSFLSSFFKFTFVFSLLLSLIACEQNSSGKANSDKTRAGKKAKSVAVAVLNPEKGTAASYYVTTATLTPSSDASINARTNGVVREIFHEEGDDVKAGDTLLKLEDDDQKLRLRQAELASQSAEREFKRLNKMKAAGAVSPTDWETANNNRFTAQTDLELAQLAFSYTQIAAPFAGRVVWRDVDLGAHVGSGDLLFRMMAIKPLLVKVHVPASRIGKVAKEQQVELTVDSVNQQLNATVDLVSPIVDPATGTVKVTLRLDNYPKGVRPGDFTQVKMITDQRQDALLLPSVAIIEERGKHHLFIEEDNKVKRQAVKIGYVLGDKTEILSGVSANDNIVVKGQRNLKDGNSVKVVGATDSSSRQVAGEGKGVSGSSNP